MIDHVLVWLLAPEDFYCQPFESQRPESLVKTLKYLHIVAGWTGV